MSQETKEKISKALMGNNNGHYAIWSEERRDSMRGKNNAWYGHHPDDETRKKISDAGKKRRQKEETKIKIANAHRGRKRFGATSRYKGVCFHKTSGKWMARVRIFEKQYYGGIYKNEIDAAKAYDKIIWDTARDISKLNFPEDYTDNE